MAVNNIVAYTDNGLTITKPQEGERHLVYVRPGDKIQLDFTDDIQYRIVDGDVLAVMSNGAQLIFLALGTMSMTPDNQQIPEIITPNGAIVDILDIAEISELTDQEKPIYDRFLDFQPQNEEPTEIEERLSRQQETLENTLETINAYVSEISNSAVAGPQSQTEQDGEQNSGTQSTVEFVQETVERVVRAPLDTTIEEPQLPSIETQTAVPKPDDEPDTQTDVPKITSVFEISSIDIYGFQGGVNTQSSVYLGGSGGENINGDVSPAARAAPETINQVSVSGGAVADQRIEADNPAFISATENAQVIEVNASLPANFSITSLTISGLPAGASVFRVIEGETTADLNSVTDGLVGSSITLTTAENQLDFSKTRFLLKYSIADVNDGDAFDITLVTTAEFQASPGVTAPVENVVSAERTFAITYRNLDTILAGENALPVQFNGNAIVTGAGNDNVIGGRGIDNISAGGGDDTITSNLGNDTIDGGSGSDTVVYSSSGISDIQVTLSDNAVGTATITNDGGETEIDSLSGVENIIGSDGSDSLTGNTADNSLVAGTGDDSVSGGFGNDFLDGGFGNDTVSYAYNTSTNATGYNIALGAVAVQTTVTGANSELDTLTNFENVIGSSLDDTIIGNADANSLEGGGGDDTLAGGGGEDVLLGGANNDLQTVYTIKADSNSSVTTGGDLVDFSDSAYDSGVELTNLNAVLSAGTNPDDNVFIRDLGRTTLGSVFGFENVVSSNGNDIITAGTTGDTVNNYFYGSYGDDVFNSGGSTTTSISSSAVVSGLETDILVTIAGGDSVDYSGLDTANLQQTDINLSSGAVTLTGNATDANAISAQQVLGFNHAVGTDKADTITGTSGANYINAGAGDDIVLGNGGADFLDGGAGNDRLSLSNISSGFTIQYDADNHWFSATINQPSATEIRGINFEQFEGSTASDQFTGSSQSETFLGNDGNDNIIATRGSDTYDGGSGIDQLNYGSSGDNRFIADNIASLVTPISILATQALGNQATEVSNLNSTVADYSVDVDFTGLRADMANTDASGPTAGHFSVQYADQTSGGDAAILATDKVQDVESIVATNLNDFVAGDNVNNTLAGADGHDFLAGRGGNDTLLGGEGNDILVGGTGNDLIDGGEGIDWVSYQYSNAAVNVDLTGGSSSGAEDTDTITNVENIRGTSAADVLTGTVSANHLIGGAGDDTLAGNGDADTLDGGEGRDTVSFDHQSYNQGSGITVNLNSGTNGVVTANYNDQNGSPFSVRLIEIEDLIGSDADDTLTGNVGDNHLQGGAGNDTLSGGTSGDDTISGGAGDDTISYSTRSGDLDGGANTDLLDLSSVSGNFSIDLSNSSDQAGAGLNFTATNFENLITNQGSQTITASNDLNIIDAGDGNDIVIASVGGLGDSDNLDGGGGTLDELDYSNATTVSANFKTDGNIAATGIAGTSTHLTQNFEILTTSNGNDVISLGDQSSIRTVVLADGNDTLEIDDAQVTLASEAITIDGGSGDDSVSFSHNLTNQAITVNADGSQYIVNNGNRNVTLTGINTISASGSADTLSTSAGIQLQGSEVTVGSNIVSFENVETLDNATNNIGNASTFSNIDVGSFSTVVAGGADDRFVMQGVDNVGSESFVFNGGSGNDILDLSATTATGNVAIDGSTIANTTLTVSGTGVVSDDTYQLSNFENLQGSNAADTWNLSNFGNTQGLHINTHNGNDIITGSNQNDTIDAGVGDDTINGGSGNNIIVNSAGNDTIDVAGAETLDYSNITDATNDISIAYADTAQFNINAGTSGGTDTVNALVSGDALDLIGGAGDDSLSVMLGGTSQLNSFNGAGNQEVSNVTDGDRIVFNGSYDAVHSISSNSVASMSNIEILDFSNMTGNLDGADKLTFSVQDLYAWASNDSGLINGTITGSREIQINIDDADISDWSKIEFDIPSGANSNPNEITFQGNLVDLSGTSGTVNIQTALTNGEHHLYFDDAGGNGQDLHVVINVV